MLNFLISLLIATQFLVPAQGIVAGAQTSSTQDFPRRRVTASFEPLVEAKSALVLDAQTGKILFQKNGFEARSIASITKLMTALVFLEQNPNWEKSVTIKIDDKQNGGKIVILPGEQLYLEDVFYTALVGSINSAAYELAVNTDLNYEEFIKRMNDKAKEIGMEQAVFVEPTGINASNRASARDIAMLLKEAMTEPKLKEALTKQTYSFKTLSGKSHLVTNTNELLKSYLNIEGGKTGYIDEAGYCLVNLIKQEATENEIIVVILGANTEESRFQENKFLAQWVFDNWEWQ